jgi:hypothetical protein
LPAQIAGEAMGTGAARTSTEAARQAGYSDVGSALRVRAAELMSRDDIHDAITEVARQTFRGFVGVVVDAAKRLILNDKHPDHAKMVNSMLGRLGFAEQTGVNINVTGEVTMSHTDAALEDLRRCLALGMTDEQLVGIFGWSGLERYRALLKSAQPKLIEYEPQQAPATPSMVEAQKREPDIG